MSVSNELRFEEQLQGKKCTERINGGKRLSEKKIENTIKDNRRTVLIQIHSSSECTDN